MIKKCFHLCTLAMAAMLVLSTTAWAQSKVYLTREISPASLVRYCLQNAILFRLSDSLSLKPKVNPNSRYRTPNVS